MKVYRNLAKYSPNSKAIVTVGTFDGVHIGHQKLLSRINEIAQREEGESVLLTFSPHPRLVLFPDDNDLRLLSTLDEKIHLLEKTGLDHLIIHPFSKEFSRVTAVEYVRDILVKRIGVHKLIIGYDHHFGRNREGNLVNLKELAPTYGFEVEEIPAQEIEDVNVSSTKIRKALMEGEMDKANEFLGYNYGLTGTVVEGDKLGRTLGFPTANIKPAEKTKLIPANGVYATRIFIDGHAHFGMTNIGYRPTISGSKKFGVETNVFEFDGDLYEKELKLEFIHRLRDEKKFKDLSELQIQLEKDAESTRKVFVDLGDR